MTKLVTITINHSHGEMLKKTLESFSGLSGDIPVDMVVVNNIPDKATSEWILHNFPGIKIIENNQPKGFAENINDVIEKFPDFDFYLLLNPDVICFPGLVKTLLKTMEADPKIGVAGPQLLNMDGSIQPSRRRFASFFVLVMRALHLDRLFPHSRFVADYLMTDTQFAGITTVNWLTGAIMLLRKNALDEVGLMDERFKMYFEDEDLCCRMWQKGWKVCYVPQAQAYHTHIAAGRNKVFSQANFQHILSAVKMLIKYRGNITRCYHNTRNDD